MNLQRREKDIQAGIVTALRAHGILSFRMNTGSMQGNHKGKPWYVRFGFPGMADLLAFPQFDTRINFQPPGTPAVDVLAAWVRITTVLWIECKRPGTKQRPDQEHFQQLVEQSGHVYLVARSADDVLKWIAERKKAAMS